jgi:hypothetical protein
MPALRRGVLCMCLHMCVLGAARVCEYLLAVLCACCVVFVAVGVYRFLLQSLIGGSVMVYYREPMWGTGHVPKKLLVRGIFGSIGMLMYFYTLQWLPLAEATILMFTNPIWTAMLAVCILKEEFTPFDAAATLVSFAGVVCVAQPEFIFGKLVEEASGPGLRCVPSCACLCVYVFVPTRGVLSCGMCVWRPAVLYCTRCSVSPLSRPHATAPAPCSCPCPCAPRRVCAHACVRPCVCTTPPYPLGGPAIRVCAAPLGKSSRCRTASASCAWWLGSWARLWRPLATLPCGQ